MRYLPYTERRKPQIGDQVRQHFRYGMHHGYRYGKVVRLTAARVEPSVGVQWLGKDLAMFEMVETLKVLRYNLRRDYRRNP